MSGGVGRVYIIAVFSWTDYSISKRGGSSGNSEHVPPA